MFGRSKSLSSPPSPTRSHSSHINKDRLYITLHVRSGQSKMPGGEDKYHWAFLLAPKDESDKDDATKYHVREIETNGRSQWIFEEKPTTLLPTDMILVRILVAKVHVQKRDRVAEILRSIPILYNDEKFNCVNWVKTALTKLDRAHDALSTREMTWRTVREQALVYVQQKKDENRFDGENAAEGKVPTYDLIYGSEVVA